MAVVGVHHTPSLTRARYEEVVRRLTDGKSRLDSLSDVGVDGLLVHVAWEDERGFWILDVWESQEAADRLEEVVAPIARQVGIEEPPVTYPAHTFVST